MQVWHKRSKPLTGAELEALPPFHKDSEWAVISMFLTEGYARPKDASLDAQDNDYLNGDPFL